MLLKESSIESYWFFNGRLFLKLSENGRRIEVIDDEDLERATAVDMVELAKRYAKPAH